VLQHKEAIPFKHFKGGRGRHAQAKAMNTPGSLAGWPKNAVKAVLNLLENAQANGESKGLDIDSLVVEHSQVNMAPKRGRRTYRAHGRINPYVRVPSHIEVVVTEKAAPVPAAKTPSLVTAFKRKLASRKVAVKTGGGA
jgi:large subunit ribosomal protein L17e